MSKKNTYSKIHKNFWDRSKKKQVFSKFFVFFFNFYSNVILFTNFKLNRTYINRKVLTYSIIYKIVRN